MKLIPLIISITILTSSCDTTRQLDSTTNKNDFNQDTLITQSLFNDKLSTISEDGIQKILDGKFKLPPTLRVALVRIDNTQRRYYWNDEDYIKTQQSYLDLFEERFKQSSRVNKIATIPDLLISKSPSFTNIREAAVRLQADIVVVYSITSDIYSKYKLFTKPDIKAFATTQVIVLDVRTGLIPFSTTITKDVVSQRKKGELDNFETRNRIQHDAVLVTINEVAQKITDFLSNN